jgi:hypothetical protein
MGAYSFTTAFDCAISGSPWSGFTFLKQNRGEKEKHSIANWVWHSLIAASVCNWLTLRLTIQQNQSILAGTASLPFCQSRGRTWLNRTGPTVCHCWNSWNAFVATSWSPKRYISFTFLLAFWQRSSDRCVVVTRLGFVGNQLHKEL